MLNCGFEPIKVVGWRKAMILWLTDKVEVLEYHATEVHSATRSFRLPAVMRLKTYIRPYLSLSVRLSRQNIFLRDDHVCQYCLNKFPEKRLTVDHVTPMSRGGRHEWTNVVTACSRCNNRKGAHTVADAGLTLARKPVKPRWLPNRDLAGDALPDQWRPYLHHPK